MTSPLPLPPQVRHVHRFEVHDAHGDAKPLAFGLDRDGAAICQGPGWWRAPDLKTLEQIAAGWQAVYEAALAQRRP